MIQWWHRLFSASRQARPARQAPVAADAACAPTAASAALTAALSVSQPASPPAPAPAFRIRAGGFGIPFEARDDVNVRYDNWLFGSPAPCSLELNPLETLVLDALEAASRSAQAASLVRRLPGLIPQLLNSLRSDTFSGAELARKISDDVVLVAAVVKRANSAHHSHHSRGQPIASIEHAVMVIGQEGLRQLITSVAFRPMIDSKSGHFTRLLAPRIWDQSERCALANRTLAADLKIAPFDAFLAGLVQDAGLMVALRMMDQLDKENPQLGKTLGSAMFCNGLRRHARTLSCRIGHEWHFSEAVTCAIGEQANVAPQMSALGQVLATGNYLGKLRTLADHDCLADAGLLDGLLDILTPQELACYRSLDLPNQDHPEHHDQPYNQAAAPAPAVLAS
jgi:HD-like signal output (HDOD) protein